eukprot:5966886-Amphidinium_carterae.1
MNNSNSVLFIRSTCRKLRKLDDRSNCLLLALLMYRLRLIAFTLHLALALSVHSNALLHDSLRRAVAKAHGCEAQLRKCDAPLFLIPNSQQQQSASIRANSCSHRVLH